MIFVLIASLIVNIILAVWVRIALRQQDAELPSFTAEPKCATCGEQVPVDPVEVYMTVGLTLGKRIPVTIKLCQECVASA